MATIAVKDTTHDLLKHLKNEVQAETYDETIRKLVFLVKKPKKSMFGKLKGVKKEFVRKELDRF